MGEIIAKVFAEQWMFMLIAAVAVAATFLIKKMAPNFYQNFLKGGLVILVLLLVVLALLVHAPDLFLLIPIIIMCCELFGYGVTGKVVAILFVDFMLIQLDYKLLANNETVMTIIFYVLQIAAAICIGIVMDGYLRKLQEVKRAGKELTEDEIESLEVEDNADASDEADSQDSEEESTESVLETDGTISDSDLDSEIDKIMSSIKED